MIRASAKVIGLSKVINTIPGKACGRWPLILGFSSSLPSTNCASSSLDSTRAMGLDLAENVGTTCRACGQQHYM